MDESQLGGDPAPRDRAHARAARAGARARSSERGRAASARSCCTMRAITEEDLLRALGMQLDIPYRRDAQPRGRRPRAAARAAHQLRQAAPAAAAAIATGRRDRAGGARRPARRLRRSTTCAPCSASRSARCCSPATRILELINQVYAKRTSGGRPGEENEERRGGRGRGAGRHPRRHRRGAHHPLGQLAACSRRSRSAPRDIHIEPGEKDVVVRYRIDGVLYETRARQPQVHRLDHRRA